MKKTFLILAIIVATPIMIYFTFKAQREGDASERRNVVMQEPKTAVEREAAKKTQEGSEKKETQDDNEIVGTILQVDVFDDDSGDFLLTVEADIPAQSGSTDDASVAGQENFELPMVAKQFLVLVPRNTPMVGGMLDELSEEDTVGIISVENFYETDKLTAISIEEL